MFLLEQKWQFQEKNNNSNQLEVAPRRVSLENKLAYVVTSLHFSWPSGGAESQGISFLAFWSLGSPCSKEGTGGSCSQPSHMERGGVALAFSPPPHPSLPHINVRSSQEDFAQLLGQLGSQCQAEGAVPPPSWFSLRAAGQSNQPPRLQGVPWLLTTCTLAQLMSSP